MPAETKKTDGIPQHTILLFRKLAKMMAPPPDLTVSQWADSYRKLSAEASAEPGQWNTDRAPYQREIMDAFADPETEKVTVMTSSQVGKTEILLNVIGYYIDYDPAPILMVEPTEGLAESYSEDRLAPMLRDSPSLREKVKEPRARDSGNTKFHKKFPGGHLTMIGANAPSQLASRPIRILLCDEVDRFPVSAGAEGDPVNLAEKRTTTFHNKKIGLVSTPTIKGVSRIESSFESGTKEHWCIPCPTCGEYQPYVWEQLKFDLTNEGELIGIRGYACRSCGVLHSETAWKRGRGKWIADNPDSKKHRSFHLNELTSPWRHWDQIVIDFLEAKKKPETLKVWKNTAMGESWEEYSDLELDDLLAKRRETYNCEVPNDAVVLTAAVDVQDNRLEYEIVAWGREKESWGVMFGIIMGDPGIVKPINEPGKIQPTVWDMLDQILTRPYVRQDGQALSILSTCIDSGGHFTSEVYGYCKLREAHRVWAIKGQGGSGPYIHRPSRRNDSGVWLFNIGVDVGKDTIYSRLKINFPGPGFCHFPIELDRGYSEEYFDGLISERRVVKYSRGQPHIQWVKKSEHARNEPFDLRNYATAALEILNPQLDSLYKQLNDAKIEQTAQQNKQYVPRRGVVSRGIDG